MAGRPPGLHHHISARTSPVALHQACHPDWHAKFISRLRESLSGRDGVIQEMLITTHAAAAICIST